MASSMLGEDAVRRTVLDLGAIVAVGWVQPADLTVEEFAEAEAYWRARRSEDAGLHGVLTGGCGLIEAWTGMSALEIGSFGIRTNLHGSDLDVGVGFGSGEGDQLVTAFAPYARFRGEQRTRFGTMRLAWWFTIGDVEIDVTGLAEEDLEDASLMLRTVDERMSVPERICHTWVKLLLSAGAGAEGDYERWKMAPYARFCSGFAWPPPVDGR